MSRVSVKAWVSGRVQGVWFRKSSQQKALSLGLSGSAVNLADGRVELHLYGESDRVDEMLSWLAVGPPRARVDELVTEFIAPGDPPGFEVG